MLTILNNVLPVFVLIILGYFLKRKGMAGNAFFQTSDRLVYFIFFPGLLFWKVGTLDPSTPESQAVFSVSAIVALGITSIVVWAMTLGYKRLAGLEPYQAGAVSQTSFRINTYMGMAIVLNTYAEPGAVCYGIMIGVLIPLNNTLAVSTLVWFGQKNFSLGRNLWVVFKGVISNPLIMGCVAGLIFSRMGYTLPGFLDNTFKLMSSITLPLALLSVGAGLSLDKLKGKLLISLHGSLFKLLAFPLVGWIILMIFGVSGLPLQVAMICCTLPTSPQTYILAKRLNSDADLTLSITVLSTLLSFFTLSSALVIF